MNLRLLEVIIPCKAADSLFELLEEHEALDSWKVNLNEQFVSVRLLLPSTRTEPLSDAISEQFAEQERFRILFYEIGATIPEPPSHEESEGQTEAEDDSKLPVARISREELYSDVVSGATLSITFIITVLLSALVAAIGLLFDDVTIIIGAMVIAPLLRPNVALALAVTLGDMSLIRKSILTNAAGIAAALILAALIGFIFHVDPENTQISMRTSVRIGHILLAMAVGVAGALAFTTGVSATLIGVMVAVALLPPLVNAGLLAGAGFWSLAYRAFILFLINVTGLNLATVITFLIQGIRPRDLVEAEKAKQASRAAIILWALLLVAFVALILLLRMQ